MLFPNGNWLLCSPTYYGVKYQINPWMDVKRQPHLTVAQSQWQELHHTLLRLGAWIEYVEPAPAHPDLVFTANAGLVKGKKFVPARFKFKERQGEEPIFRKWFAEDGYDIVECKQGSFEGEGDALFSDSSQETLFVGHGFRTDLPVVEELKSLLNLKNVIACELIDSRFYHLDTCFCPINKNQALYFPGAFKPDSIARMKQHIDLLPITPGDAEKFACNAVVLGKQVVLPAQCAETEKLLKSLGYESFGVELGEFLKAGGSAKCLSLRIQ